MLNRARLMNCLAAAGAVALSVGVMAGGVAPAAAGGLGGPGTATVFAGGAGGPGPGTKVTLYGPCGLASSGDQLFVADAGAGVIRSLNLRTGWMRNVAGTGLPGLSGVGGPALEAEPGNSCLLIVDHHGNVIMGTFFQKGLVVAQRSGSWYGPRMRAGYLYQMPVSSGSEAVDYAGNLVLGAPGSQPSSTAVQVFAARSGRFYGQQMTAGKVYALTATGTSSGSVVAVDAAGNPVIEDNDSLTVIAARSGPFDGRRMLAGHGYRLYQGVSGPAAADRYGNFILINQTSQYLQQLDVLATRAGTFYGRHMRPGHLYKFTKPVAGFSGDGGPVSAAQFSDAGGVTVDSDGNWVLGDVGNNRVRVVAARSGRFYGIAMRAMHIYTVAGPSSPNFGDGGEATRALLGLGGAPTFSQPPLNYYGVSADQASNVYLSDTPENRVRMIPGHSGAFFGQRMRAGDIYTIAGNGIRGDPGNGVLATKAALGYPFGVTTDRAGNVLFADKAGKIRVVAARTGTFYGIRMRVGRLYTIAGGGSQVPVNGIKATSALMYPVDVKVDGHGNVLISDQAFSVWLMPAASGTYFGQHMTAGDYYKIGSAYVPAGMTVDQAGNVLVADYGENLVQVIAARTGLFYGQQMTAGHSYTIAGGGPLHGAGHLAVRSAIGHPEGVAVDRSGNLVITISGIRKLVQVVPARTGMFCGQQMTARHLYTIAGGGFATVPGNRPSVRLKLLSPQGVALLPSGDVLFYVPSEGRVFRVRTC